MSAEPVQEVATNIRLQVAAIDFGTTYSGYAFSFRSDFLENPLKIHTNKWHSSSSGSSLVSMKAPSCVLFSPEKTFHSFGYEAEDHYMELSREEHHKHWYFFKRFKMLLYKNKHLKFSTPLPDCKGRATLPAIDVFSACIRYLKEHLLKMCREKEIGIREKEMHWVLTVPAIWDDSAKQFMREAGVKAGIHSEQLSLALEPEAASLFCRFLPVKKIHGVNGVSDISNLAPGNRYLVLDAGGGTVDITVHETQTDGTVRELYKANGGPWGGTNVDKAFIEFLEDIAGKDVIDAFIRDNQEDYIQMVREFEIKKKSLHAHIEPNEKITFKIPFAIHDIYKQINGIDFRKSLTQSPEMCDEVTFAGDKIRICAGRIKTIMFDVTFEKILSHLKDILSQNEVKGTETILMVGGFSESSLLQEAIKRRFPRLSVIIPEDAGLAVLMGAVLYGHHPSAIVTRVSRYTYGVKTYRIFDPAVHPCSRKVTIGGRDVCRGCFDKHVEIGQAVQVGMSFRESRYCPPCRDDRGMAIKLYTSEHRDPKFVDEYGCCQIGSLEIDFSDIANSDNKCACVKLIYGKTELGVEARCKSGDVIRAAFKFLE